MTGDTTPQDLAQEINDYLAEGWSGPRDRALLEKAAGLLSSPDRKAEEDLLHRIRQVLHDNNLGCVEQPGKHDKVAREILEEVCRSAPTPPAAPVRISEVVFLRVVEAAGDWDEWSGNRIAAAALQLDGRS